MEDGTIPSEIIRPLPSWMGFRSAKCVHDNALPHLAKNPPDWQLSVCGSWFGGLTRDGNIIWCQ